MVFIFKPLLILTPFYLIIAGYFCSTIQMNLFNEGKYSN